MEDCDRWNSEAQGQMEISNQNSAANENQVEIHSPQSKEIVHDVGILRISVMGQ